MTISLESIPRFTAAQALAVAERAYGIGGHVSELPSERDQNFSIEEPGGRKYVLKIANRDDVPAFLEFQNQAMRRVASAVRDCEVQHIVPTRTGADMSALRDRVSGVDHRVRVLTWIDGEVLAKCRPRAAALFDSIGASMAGIDAALGNFAHPAMHRVLQWDLRHAGLARDKSALLPRARRARVERAFADWERIDWTRLRHGVIHGDANDYNVLVQGGRMSGLLDFGDMVYSAIVCDLAIALAYAMFYEQNPLARAQTLIRGYHRRNPLDESEQRVLFPLVLARLCASVCYSAHNRARTPDDAYQVVSEAAAWDLLDKLESHSTDTACAMIREACAAAGVAPS